MRPIKFRVWDKETKTMDFPSDILELKFEEKGRWFALHQNGKLFTNYLQGELMQFTGLLDKNGKEIYEGDIVFTQWNEDFVGTDPGSKQIVYWSDDLGGWATNEEGKDGKWNSHLVFHCFPTHTEVIGNIHQHPETIQ